MSNAVLTRDLTVARPATRLSRKRALLAAAGLAVLLAGAYYARQWWTDGRFMETTDDAYVGGDVTSIAPHVAGFVAEVPVTDNQRVAAGQVISRLDASDFQVALDRARATLEARYGALQGAVDGGHAAALRQLWHLAYREASTLAYADAFRAIMLAFVVATLLVPLLRTVGAPAPSAASAH
jgi:multidrug resistance efflux pump